MGLTSIYEARKDRFPAVTSTNAIFIRSDSRKPTLEIGINVVGFVGFGALQRVRVKVVGTLLDRTVTVLEYFSYFTSKFLA